MNHWGWYWKVKNRGHNPKTLCSALPTIDSFLLFRKKEKCSFRVSGYQLLAIPGDSCFMVYYGKNKRPSYRIPVEKQQCNYGGYRYYFQCPLCQKRMRKLYFSNGAFLCRKCLNLAYYTQRLRSEDRFGLMRIEIEKSIKSRGGDLALDIKPPRIHQKTFNKLKDKASYYDARSGLALYADLRDWYGPKVEGWVDGYLEYEWEMIIAEYREKYQGKSN